MEKQIELIVSSEDNKERIDKFLNNNLEDISRSRIQKLIEEGNVTLNGNICSNVHEKLKENDCLIVEIPEPVDVDIKPENIPLDIIYEDDDIIIVNKEKGMVVHPSAGHYSGTLVNALMYHFAGNLSGINGELRPGIVHRIDMDTSGILVICKNDKAHNYIADLLSEHNINRIYYCIVHGLLKEEVTVDAPIGRAKNDRKKQAIDKVNGKRAVTHFKPLAILNNKYTLVECKLETGRTHQIRVHMASIHHPLVGDKLYNTLKSDVKYDGQALHAAVLGFTHPSTGKYIEFRSKLPNDFTGLCIKFGGEDAVEKLNEYLSINVIK